MTGLRTGDNQRSSSRAVGTCLSVRFCPRHGAAAREVAEAPADDAVAEAAPEGEAPPAAEGEAPSATEVEPAAAESAATEAVPSADGEVEPPAEGATEGSAEDAAEGAETASGGAAEANMSRLLAADAQRSDDPDLEAPVSVAAASPSNSPGIPFWCRVAGHRPRTTW